MAASRRILITQDTASSSVRSIPDQPQRVNPLGRTWAISIDINAAFQTDRVRADEPPRRGIVVPVPVVAEPSLGIELLPLKLILMSYSYIVAAIKISAKTRQFTVSRLTSLIIPMFS